MTRPTDANGDGENTGDPLASSPKDDWAAILAARPQAARTIPNAPAQGLLLTFVESGLERAFRQFEFERSKKVLAWAFGIANLIGLSFLGLDQLTIPPEHLELVRSSRIAIVIPASLAYPSGEVILRW